MLKPEYLERLPASLVRLYAQVEQDILSDMAARIAAFDDFIPAAEWQYRKLVEMGRCHDFIVKALASKTHKTEEEIKEMMKEAGVKTLAFDDSIYKQAGLDPPPITASPILQEIINDGIKATGGLFENLAKTTADTATKQFEKALDRAWLQIQTGAFSRQEATTMAIKDLCKAGINAIEYPSGHIDKLDVAVRRAVITGVNQCALRMQLARMEEMGCDLVEVSAHSGARPDHAAWQGRIFSISGKHPKYPNFADATGYGTGAGLGGWNCRHSFFPYIEGISRPEYTAAALEEMNAPKYAFNGKHYTEYEATQKQRAFERQLRRWKREKAALERADADSAEAAAKLKKTREKLVDFLDQTGLKRHYDREAA